MQDDFQLTIRDAAKALGVSPSSCRRYLKQGKLEAIRETRSDGTERYLISRASVIAYDPAAESKLPPAPESSEAVTFTRVDTEAGATTVPEPAKGEDAPSKEAAGEIAEEPAAQPAGILRAAQAAEEAEAEEAEEAEEPEEAAGAAEEEAVAAASGEGHDGEFLTELTSSLEREVETHSMVPVELYREIRTKHENALERAARAEGELAQLKPEAERLRVAEREMLEKVAGLEKEVAHLREQLERLNSPKLASMFRGFMGKAEG